MYLSSTPICYLCGQSQSVDNYLSRDHIVPLSRKSKWEQSIFAKACVSCNQFKGCIFPYFPNLIALHFLCILQKRFEVKCLSEDPWDECLCSNGEVFVRIESEILFPQCKSWHTITFDVHKNYIQIGLPRRSELLKELSDGSLKYVEKVLTTYSFSRLESLLYIYKLSLMQSPSFKEYLKGATLIEFEVPKFIEYLGFYFLPHF